MACFKSAANGEVSEPIHWFSLVMDIALTSAMFFPSILHDNTRLLRRVPPQSGQVPMRSIGLSTAA